MKNDYSQKFHRAQKTALRRGLIEKWSPVLELPEENVKETLAALLESQPVFTTFQRIKHLLKTKSPQINVM